MYNNEIGFTYKVPSHEHSKFGETYLRQLFEFVTLIVAERRIMVELNIEDYIQRELSSEEQKDAMCFVCFLKDNHLSFYKDNCDYWKDKIYYWVKLDNECVCFVAIKKPDEKNNHWTVWSADMGSQWLEEDFVDGDIKQTAWKYVDHCGCCGSCSGGRHKIVFGKEFDDVCGCTFRIDNPKHEDISFLKKMVEIRIKEISNKP